MTALRERDFRQLWLAGLISDTGDWMLLVSLPVLVYQLTGSALGTSVAFLTELIPAVLVAPLAGWLADRMNRRTLLVIVSLFQALTLLPLLAGPRLPVVYAVIAVEAGLAAFFDPAKNALLPTLVDEAQLVSANSLTGLNQNLGRLVGGSLGGLLLAAGDLRVIAAADAATFVAAAALIAGLRSAPPAAVASSRSGAGHPFRRRPVRAGLAVLALTSVGQGLFVVLFVVFVARVLHGNAAENGLLRAVQAIGSIGGGLALARASRIRSGRLASVACLTFGALAVATWNLPGLTRAEPVYLALFIAFGVPSIALVTGLLAALQQATLDGERGRVIAACGVAMAVGQGAGIGLAGLLGDRLGVIPLLDGQAALYLIGGLAALAWLAERAGPARHAPPLTVIGPAGSARPAVRTSAARAGTSAAAWSPRTGRRSGCGPRAAVGRRLTLARRGDSVDDLDDQFLELIHSLEELRDGITPERAHAEFDETTLQVFWKKWPSLSAWAGSLWRMLSEELAGPATPHRDPELDEVGGSG